MENYIIPENIIPGDPMAGVVLAAIQKEGSLATAQIYKLFQRNRSARELDETLERLRSAKKIKRGKEATGGRSRTVWSPRDKVKERATQATATGHHRIFCCVRYPALTIGKLKFEGGFLVTDNAQAIQLIEQSVDFGVSIQDITQVIQAILFSKRIFLSSQPSIEIEHHPHLNTVEFEKVADGLYILVCKDHELAPFVERTPYFRTGQVREVPRTLVEAARGSENDPTGNQR